MIIYNGTEYDSKYVFQDDYIVEINSLLSLEDILQLLRDNKPLSKDEVSIHVYKVNEGKFITQEDVTAISSSSDNSYDRFIDEDDLEDYEDAENERRSSRNTMFSAFEAYQFNHPWRHYAFEQVDNVDDLFIKRQIYSCLGIMPTVRNHEKTIKELKQLSAKGDRLYRSFLDVSLNNRLPSMQDIAFYDTLNDYEKRIIHDSGVHPMRLLDLARMIKDKDPGRILTVNDEVRAHSFSNDVVASMSLIPGFHVNTNEIHSIEEAKLMQYLKDFPRIGLSDRQIVNIVQKLYEDVKNASLFYDQDGEKTIYPHLSSIDEVVSDMLKEGKPEEDALAYKEKEVETFFRRKMLQYMIIPEDLLEKLPTNDISDKLVKYYKDVYKKEFLPAFAERDVTQKDGSVVHVPAGFQEEDMIQWIKRRYKEPRNATLDKAEEIFKEMFHGHAPRVLAEYMYAQALCLGKTVSELTEEEIRNIASKFDQKNVSKIVKYKNFALFALADKLNFAEVRMDHMEALAVYSRPEEFQAFLKKGFIEWYKENLNTPTSDFIELIQKQRNIQEFKKGKSAKELIFDITQSRGLSESKLMERKYGYKFDDNETAIRGRHIKVQDGKMSMYMLDSKDYRHFTVGYDTHCCQHYGDAGESCVYKATTDPFASTVVIERDGKILAQGFVWTDEAQDILVFDNIEFAEDRQVAQFSDIIAAWAKAMPYKNIHVGTGYNNTMMSWGKEAIDKAILPTTIDGKRVTSWGNGNCYTDYHVRGFDSGNMARMIKNNGQLLIKCNRQMRITSRPDEPTKWDILARPENAIWLNDWETPIDERIHFAEEFLNNPTPELQMKAVSKNPSCIKFIEAPAEEVQLYVIRQNPKLAVLIQNPCEAVQKVLMDIDVNYIRKIQNPSEEMALKAVTQNGLLLECLQHPSEQVINAAVSQNGYAIKFIPNPSENVQLLAVHANPKVVTLIPHASDAVKSLAVRNDPRVLQLMDNPSEDLQMIGVEADPYIINDIKNPCENAVKKAIQKNGLLIRNFQFEYPNLRMMAVKQNGFALRLLDNPSEAEMIAAVRQNRGAMNCIKNPDALANVLSIIDGHYQDEMER